MRSADSRPTTSPQVQAHVVQNYGKLPLSFEMNRGQTDDRVQFISRGSAYSLFLERNESVLVLRGGSTPDSDLAESSIPARALRMQLVGGNPSTNVRGIEELPGKSNYFIGNDPSKWLTNFANYSKVKYESA